MRAEEWFAEHIPDRWPARAIEVLSDPDEILVVVDLDGRGGDAASAIAHFRDDTREERMAIAAAAEKLFATKVSWGARRGREIAVFTTASVPVMTRLRINERRVLDTLIDGGVARTRSEALAWCVRLVGEHEKEWLAELRTAFHAVEEVREKGPRSRR
ncbi:MAG TPA: hypothetical protein VFH70_13015 [Acidimicrobiales bacterium]|nr:hypothetical protein [Acidimicrobiales bacterium]